MAYDAALYDKRPSSYFSGVAAGRDPTMKQPSLGN